MNKITWTVIGVICLLGLGGLIAFTKQDEINVDNIDPVAVIKSENASISDRTTGKTGAKVVVFEYADYQCPGCGVAYSTVKSIQETYKDKVTFVFRNFPLTSAHPNALAAASAAEAAGQQGKFWEMHDLLFAQRSDWVNSTADQRNDVFVGYAKQLNLDIDKFTTDQSSKTVAEKISRDRALGGKVNVNSTPSFFIGSTKLDAKSTDDVINGKSDSFMSQLDTALKAAGETPPSH